ncbi:MAG TPA: AAA family ATPase [Gemmatimonadaceae bacterium]|nr:AAA family ATPase [Gemmatimonadaceae bacterium]
MGLLERADELAVLDDAARRAAGGAGSVVLVSGEAGIGKSALLAHAFTSAESHGARVFWGACDPLSTPRPLGPLHDIARQVGGTLLDAATSSIAREILFGTMLDHLRRESAPIVMVVEDVHWADEATLDLLTFLSRRIRRTSALLVITYRDDEVGPTHPLRAFLGHLPPTDVRRLPLAPLSLQAVDAMARDAGRSARQLFDVTGGNPFFVTEVLASNHDLVPVTVRDAVLARMAGLSDSARSVAELAAVAPLRIERWLIDDLLSPPSAAIDECRAIGILQGDGDSLAFRHELARRAIEDSLTQERRRVLHANCLMALLAREGDAVSAARLVHHAELAGDAASLHRYGVAAAAQAASFGNHREAATLYERALRAADVLPIRERARLLEHYSVECYLSEPIDAACSARAEALVLWQQDGDRLREGDSLRWLSRIWWFRGVRADAERFAADAIAVLEQLPPSHELAMAYSNRSQLAMLAADIDGAVEWGARALDVAEPLGDTECQVNTLITVGSAEHTSDRPGGLEKLERGLALALEYDYPEAVVRAYTNLTTNCAKKCDYDRAERYLRDGLEYCEPRAMNSWSLYILACRAHVRFQRGDWTRAVDDASSVLSEVRSPAVCRIHAMVVLARVRMHRQEPGWEALLDEARDLALPTGERQRIAPVACARAEAAWLLGDVDRAADEAMVGWAIPTDGSIRWEVGQLALSLWRANRLPEIRNALPAAVERQIAGDWRAAADEWERLGSPLQQAAALADADDAGSLHEALAVLTRLGSEAGCALVRRRMRSLRIRGIPRGARPSTRSNPARLTTRQLEILALVCEGRRDAEIAAHCFLSTKTVGHHVSAILGKLGVRSRGEASAAARAIGIFPE